MCQFIESIKLKDGHIYHLDWHQKRVDETFEAFFPNKKPVELAQIIENVPSTGLYKIRCVYNDNDTQLEILAYYPRKITTFELVEIDFTYDFKFADRQKIQEIATNSEADEVIFMQKGHLLDATYANLAFYDGHQWFTPTTFLLNGTTRQRLLLENKIKCRSIKKEDLPNFEKVSFINALNDLGENCLNLSA